jgi:putative peptidoglycan lipid II flippase
VVNVIIASGLAAGSLAAIKSAWQVMTMPEVVIAQAIAIAALPTFSAQVGRGDTAAMRSSLAATLRGMVLLSLPASLGLILLRHPLIALLFQRGAFDPHSTDLVAWALLWYAAGLLAHNLVEILSRAFYALHDTKTPVLVGTGAMTLNVVFSLGFTVAFAKIGWMAHGGLALANSAATALEMTALLLLMRRRLNGLQGAGVGRSLLQAASAALIMSLSLLVWLRVQAPDWLLGLGGAAIGITVYFAALWGLRVPEVDVAYRGIMRRLRAGRTPEGI